MAPKKANIKIRQSEPKDCSNMQTWTATARCELFWPPTSWNYRIIRHKMKINVIMIPEVCFTCPRFVWTWSPPHIAICTVCLLGRCPSTWSLFELERWFSHQQELIILLEKTWKASKCCLLKVFNWGKTGTGSERCSFLTEVRSFQRIINFTSTWHSVAFARKSYVAPAERKGIHAFQICIYSFVVNSNQV